MKRILFSPVGTTDPISNYRDGALLHIARIQQLDKIYIFLSKETGQWDRENNRYEYCLNRLKEEAGKAFEIEKIDRPELEDVHIFDEMLNAFNNLLKDIVAEMADEDELYLNVSSGTPAMKSALQVLAATSERRMIPLQVSTPIKAHNDTREDPKNYPVEEQWEFNDDNKESEFINRLTVSSNTNMLAEMNKNMIKKFIEEYDYFAALKIAETIKNFIPADSITLLKAMVARVNLDKGECDRLMNKLDFEMFPVKTSGESSIFEFLMLCKLKIEKKEYADFLRSVSPLFFAILERIVIKKLQFNLEDFYKTKKGINGTLFKSWDIEGMKTQPGLLDAIGLQKDGKDPVVTSAHLVNYINNHKNNIGTTAAKQVEDIRKVEKDVRNPIAHCLTYMTEDVIRNATGITADQIWKGLLALAKFSGISIKDEDLKTYEKCNDEIKKYLFASNLAD